MTTRVYSNYESFTFSAGQGYETVVTENYAAEVDDDLARHLCKAFFQFFRAEPWPDGLKISDADVMDAIRKEDDPEVVAELEAMGVTSPADNSISMNLGSAATTGTDSDTESVEE